MIEYGVSHDVYFYGKVMGGAMRKLPCVAVCCAALLLSSCQTTGREAGAIGGAVAGAIVGSLFGKGAGQLVAIAAGAVVGGIVGSAFGGFLDEQEAAQMEKATNSAVSNASTGEEVAWKAVDRSGTTSASGWVVPTTDRYSSSNGTCRKVRQIALKNGERTEDEVELCNDGRGSGWQIPA